MAQGFLSQSKGNKSMECLGHDYFKELKSRSFFQQAANNDFEYTMHDLINDMATSVAIEFSFRLKGKMDVSTTNESFDKLRHFAGYLRYGSFRKLKELQRAKRLRTLLLMSNRWENADFLDNLLVELLPQLQFLRVLSVIDRDSGHYRSISPSSQIITNVPQSIGSLKHLQYLNFSYTGITRLPEEVSDLYNLQSLLVHELSGLPQSFVKLINLRHLDISDTPKVNKMPLGISGLTSLQTLTKVIIEEGNGFKISDLEGLSDLHGRLSIMGLDRVTFPTQAKEANLHQKKGLNVLEMEWSDDGSQDEMIEYEVLNELRPHPKLKILKILFYKGTRFPTWVGDSSFDQLTELTICGSRSTHIPTLGHLRSLKKLFVKKMNEVKTVGFELLAPANSNIGIAFPSLEVLKFNDMQGWERWSIDIGIDHGTPRSFPRLHKISIKSCPELADVSIGLIPSIRVLHIEECSRAVLRSMVGLSPLLVELKMSNVKGLTQLHGEDLMHLGEVERLYINGCDYLRYLWEGEPEACKNLVSLQKLEVWFCENLVSSAEEDVDFGVSMESLKQVMFQYCDMLESYRCPNSVESLEIRGCNSMTSLSLSQRPSTVSESKVSDRESIQQIPTKVLRCLPVSCLTSLHVTSCLGLKSFPHEHFQGLASLEELEVRDCPSIDYSFPCGLWPPNLSKLTIGCLNKPMSEWGAQNYPSSLVELILYGENSGVVSFAVALSVRNTTTPSSCFLLPPSLVLLALYLFKDVQSFSEGIQCLKTLNIMECPKLRDVVKTVSPSHLTVNVWDQEW